MEDAGSGVFKPVNVPSTQNNFIQSGQAFFVQPATPGVPADLVFNEYNKSGTGNNLKLFRPSGASIGSFKTYLLKRDEGNTSLADGVAVQLDESFAAGIDAEDALKFYNVAENLALMRQGSALTVEKRPVFTENDTLFYRLTKTTERNYQLKFIAEEIGSPGVQAYLEDSYTGFPTLIALSGTTIFNFDINADAASAAPDRLRIIFKAAASGPLAVAYCNVKAHLQGEAVMVDWTVKNNNEAIEYVVQKC